MTSDQSTSGLIVRLVRVLLSRRAVLVYWIMNFFLLAGLIVWIYRDGKFSQAASLMAQLTPWSESDLQYGALPSHLATRVQMLHVMIVAGIVTLAGIVIALFVGTGPNRSMRAWLSVMFLLAVWLTLYTSWPEFACAPKPGECRVTCPQ